jgi:GT2 family glycosyltransferase
MDDPEVGMAGPKLLFPEDDSRHGPPGRIQHAGIEFDIGGHPQHVFIGWSADHPKANQECNVPAITGACFITRRNIWREAGGMQALYGAGTYEDVDYCFSVRSMNKYVRYVPGAVASHRVGGSITNGANQQGFNLAINETIFRGRWAHMLRWTEWIRY